jgi:hypothetical protein
MTGTPDAYDTLTGLIALLADSKAATARIAELQKLERQIARAQAQLAIDREAHDRKAAELDAREAALQVREEAVTAAEVEYFQQQPRERFPLSGNGDRFTRSYSGLVRE